ncbi:MAG: CPBP family intramembrane metalloprotease [Candidatus Omnitrophica bacterium]|nr:CPBP family intramembrane metalloprotease [Candidatus Omnitrophota bacterium]
MANVFSKFKLWFSQTLAFLKSEPLMTFCLVTVLVVYGGLALTHHKKPHEPSKAMQQIQMAEEKLKAKEDSQILKEFILKEAGPFELFLLICVPVLLSGALVTGIFLDSYLVGKITNKKEIIEPVAAHPEAVLWGVREIIKSVIYVISAGVILSVVLGVVQGALFQKEKTHENVLLIVHTVLVDIFILWFMIYSVTHTFGERLSALGFRFKKWGQDLWLGILGYTAILPIVLIVMGTLVVLAGLIHYEPAPHPLVELFVEEDYKNPALIYFSIFLACTIGPIIEEIFFRGWCYPAFKKQWGQKWAMVISSAFFAAIHNSLFAFLPIFVLGLIFAYVYEKRGSLIPSIVMHIAHNTIFIGYFFLLKRSVLDKLVAS